MFERRLKIFLLALIAVTAILVLRALHLQLVQRGHWEARASGLMSGSQVVETTRGRILDFKGRPVALDEACIDACVDYRAIKEPPDAAWVEQQAAHRVLRRMGAEYRKTEKTRRKQLVAEESARVKADLDAMWQTLGRASGQSIEEISQVRQNIVRRIEMRRRYVWYRKYERAKEQHDQESDAWYKRWLVDEQQSAPRIDQFGEPLWEELQPHVIVPAIGIEIRNLLAKQLDRYPGLVLRPGTHRVYPYGDVACHVIGQLSPVVREDLLDDPFFDDERRKYWPNDLIGRTGIESMAEPLLRGSRGGIELLAGREIERKDPRPGDDARMTIDIELQHQIQSLFTRQPRVVDENTGAAEDYELHGAAVVIDVPTGEVRALVSYPTFDLNQYKDLYPTLVKDDVNAPLLNRATQWAVEPGSTVKPIVGLAAIAQGLISWKDTIECTGYLVLRGRKMPHGRCWVASQFEQTLREAGMTPAHHPVPWNDPHPTGFLTFTDSLQRSCNIYFETLGDRMGVDGLRYWFDRFGLGRPTGVGLPETSGQLPRTRRQPSVAWFASMGQGEVTATPLQIANVAASIARGGTWVRPHLLQSELEKQINKIVASTQPAERVDRVNLKLPPEAVAAAREGMVRVVSTEAGTGKRVRRPDIKIAGKTGSAQATRLTVPVRDAAGDVVRDEKGRVRRRVLEPAELSNPNPEAPWYRRTGDNNTLTHAWFMGFAPAENPQVAFAVMVEYGGSGGGPTSGAIAKQVIEACVQHGYLAPNGGGAVSLTQW